jgi:ubiquitin-conjugating enzyme E2 J1
MSASSWVRSNPAIRRIRKEIKELRDDNNSCYAASPLEDDVFEWHFTIRGPKDSAFEGGIYHGRILLPNQYPNKPPNIVFLTENGRWQTHKKICLSISAYHPEAWNPAWSIRTVLLALIGFMPTKGGGAIGALDYTADERKRLAAKSIGFKCSRCGCANMTALPPEDAQSVQDTLRDAEQLLSNTEITTTAPTGSTSIDTPARVAAASSSSDADADVDVARAHRSIGALHLSASTPPSLADSSAADDLLSDATTIADDGDDVDDLALAQALQSIVDRQEQLEELIAPLAAVEQQQHQPIEQQPTAQQQQQQQVPQAAPLPAVAAPAAVEQPQQAQVEIERSNWLTALLDSFIAMIFLAIVSLIIRRHTDVPIE